MRVDGNFIDELLLRELARKITMQNRSTGGRSAVFRSVNIGGFCLGFFAARREPNFDGNYLETLT